MKKLLILVMLLSMGLAGVASAGRGNFTMYRWDNNDSGTSVAQYQRDFSQLPTSKFTVTTNGTRFPTGNPLPTSGVEYPNWDNGTNFGCRFEGWLLPPVDGKYTFWISADDGAELWLSTDDTPANAVRISSVGAWTNQREWGKEAGQKSAEITLSASKAYFWYSVYKEGGGGDGMSLAWGSPEAGITGPTVIDRNYVTDTLAGVVTGLSNMPGGVEYEVWNVGSNGTGVLPDFSTLPAPDGTGTLPMFGVGPRAGTDNFTFRQKGIIKVPADGVLGFSTSSDDGSKLYVGQWWTGGPMTLVVNNDGWHGMQLRSGSIAVTAGYVGIVVEQFEDGGGEGLEVYYYSDTIPSQQIPASALISRIAAGNPSPASNAVGVAVGTPLSWTKPFGKEAATNRVMFGESGQALAEVYTNIGTTFSPTLVAGKTYSWRVDVLEPNLAGPNPIVIKGQGWGFTTLAAPAAKQLLAYWPLDADLSDASGKGLITGKYFSNDASAPVFEPGMKGNAIAINIADTANAQYAKLADWGDPTLSTVGVNAAMPRTMSCWVKNAITPMGAPSDWCTVFGFTSYPMSSNGLGRYSFDFDKRGGQEQYCIHRNGGEWNIQAIDGNWHHLTASYSGGVNRIIRYYSDGKLIGATGATSLYTQDIVHIGKRAHSNPLWRGWVDEARIYNYEMTAQEVYERYVADGGTPSATPQCFGPTYPAYDFNKNCVVDTADLLMFATQWLQDNLVN